MKNIQSKDILRVSQISQFCRYEMSIIRLKTASGCSAYGDVVVCLTWDMERVSQVFGDFKSGDMLEIPHLDNSTALVTCNICQLSNISAVFPTESTATSTLLP